MSDEFWPGDDETIHQMGLIMRAAIEIADTHDNTVDEVLSHVLTRWRKMNDYGGGETDYEIADRE